MKTLLSAIALTFCVVLSFGQNHNIIKISNTTFSVGIYSAPFRFERTAPGSDGGGGWAACVMMVLNYDGLNVSQEQVASVGATNQRDKPGSPQPLMFAINKTTPPAWGTPSKIFCEANNVDYELIFDELAANRPLITSGSGRNGGSGPHVVTAMSYTIQFNNKGEQTGITPLTVTLKNPNPAALATRTVQWVDFVSDDSTTLYTIKVVPKNTVTAKL